MSIPAPKRSSQIQKEIISFSEKKYRKKFADSNKSLTFAPHLRDAPTW